MVRNACSSKSGNMALLKEAIIITQKSVRIGKDHIWWPTPSEHCHYGIGRLSEAGPAFAGHLD